MSVKNIKTPVHPQNQYQNTRYGESAGHPRVKQITVPELTASMSPLSVFMRVETTNAETLEFSDIGVVHAYDGSRPDGITGITDGGSLSFDIMEKSTYKMTDFQNNYTQVVYNNKVANITPDDMRRYRVKQSKALADKVTVKGMEWLASIAREYTPGTGKLVEEIKKAIIDMEKVTGVPRDNFSLILSQNAVDIMEADALANNTIWTGFVDMYNNYLTQRAGVKSVTPLKYGTYDESMLFMITIKEHTLAGLQGGMDLIDEALVATNTKPGTRRIYSDSNYGFYEFYKNSVTICKNTNPGGAPLVTGEIHVIGKELYAPDATVVDKTYMIDNLHLSVVDPITAEEIVNNAEVVVTPFTITAGTAELGEAVITATFSNGEVVTQRILCRLGNAEVVIPSGSDLSEEERQKLAEVKTKAKKVADVKDEVAVDKEVSQPANPGKNK